METAMVPCEMRSQSDSVTLILRPTITQASWSDIEAFGANVRQELEQRPSPACVVDLSPLNYMGSAIVALIVRVWKVVQAKGGKMVVVCPNASVLEVIRLAGLDKIWMIASDTETANRKLGLRSATAKPMETTTPKPSSRVWYFALGVVTALLALMGILLFMNK